MTGMGGEGGEGGSDDAGPPFSRETFDVLYKTASFQGWSMRGDYDTGRCEVLKQIVEHMPVQDDYEGASRLTEEQAYAMTAPNGSLTVTINSWTAGDPVPASPGVREEALDAVGACPDYIVGTRISEDD